MTEAAEPDFDVIVIGAGIAGAITAYQLATQGRSVVLIERGEAPGAKNLSGGVLYCRGMQEVFPDFLTEAPVERRITRNYINFLNADSSIGIDYKDTRLSDPVNAVTVLRAKLDPWLAEKCEEAGVFLMPGVRVDKVLTEDGPTGKRVVGVKAGDDELRAHVVVAADGVNSFISQEVGLRTKEPLNHLAIGVKCVVNLPRETIEARFSVTGDEGAAFAIVGDCTQGIGGGGFMYTNTESISVGVVLRLDDLTAKNKSTTDILDYFLAHPFIAPYLEGGEVVEYGCHLVAEGGLAMLGEISMDGLVVVGDAAGLTLNTGLTVRGMDLAVASGVAAAKGIGAALDSKDTSKVGLAGYREALFASYAGKDMETYAKAPAFLETERMYKEYGELIGNVLYGVFNLDNSPREHLLKVAMKAFKKSPVKIKHLIKDGLAGVRAL
ncbi:FAD-dependent oxidoreductase [Pengzhenrongella frigida]|uniref:FAD-dependent oxidoreductase n=1 Tax=Pengzhenrongella frigida TaxID=1259133 RepID=A0A4Q5MVY9_9MICO|nr:FAD-dependent oxidoreductase [Cellulomonas sp. HLT2-17]RYV49738.1 FAD-dependent oxidoreductase [Cellulomonas sp. HLT2-17]